MKVITASDLRANLANVFDAIEDDAEGLVVTTLAEQPRRVRVVGGQAGGSRLGDPSTESVPVHGARIDLEVEPLLCRLVFAGDRSTWQVAKGRPPYAGVAVSDRVEAKAEFAGDAGCGGEQRSPGGDHFEIAGLA